MISAVSNQDKKIKCINLTEIDKIDIITNNRLNKIKFEESKWK
jgi:hypothetical protein